MSVKGTDTGVRVWERVWAASGALTVVLFAGGIVCADLLGSNHYPVLDASGAALRRYFVDNASEVRALSFFHMLAALALLSFAAYLSTVLRSDEEKRSGLPALACAGGVTAAVFLSLSAISFRVLSEPPVAQNAALAHATLVLSYLAGGPAITVPLALLIGTAVPSALGGSVLPRWIGWLGIAAVAVSLASPLIMLGPTNDRSAIFGILILGIALDLGWLFSASLGLATRRRR